MKPYIAFLLFAFLPACLFARDITTLSGTAYKDAKVFDSNAAELIISYQDKTDPKLTILKPIPFTDLPDDIRKEFKYDPVKAEAFEKARKEEKEREKAKAGEKKLKESSADGKSPNATGLQLKKTDIAPDQIGGGVAPGEKEGVTEGNAMKQEAGQAGLAPGEKEGAAEGAVMKKEAGQGGLAPGEKNNAAEANAMKKAAGKTDYAPGEKELLKEGDAIKRDAEKGGKAPGER